MSTGDARWKQRLQNFSLAYEQLKSAVDLAQRKELSDLEKQGLIQAFEFTHELAWNVLKDYFDFQGSNQISGSRDATREAFQKGLIEDGVTWMEMIQSRNKTSHTYNKVTADEIVGRIQHHYFAAFTQFFARMQSLLKQV